jgi:hypothetical protein
MLMLVRDCSGTTTMMAERMRSLAVLPQVAPLVSRYD